MLSTTEDHLEEVFTKAADPQPAGKKAVERVKKLKDYAFIHFSEREEALRALKAINGETTMTSLECLCFVRLTGCSPSHFRRHGWKEQQFERVHVKLLPPLFHAFNYLLCLEVHSVKNKPNCLM